MNKQETPSCENIIRRLDSIEHALVGLSLEVERIMESLPSISSGKTMTMGRFCMELGISPERLKALYWEYCLPIDPPYRSDGHNPKYSQDDLKTCRQVISEQTAKRSKNFVPDLEQEYGK